MGIRGELYSAKFQSEGRTYFFNVKQNRMGDVFLSIVESKPTEGEMFDRHAIVVFGDQMPGFLDSLRDALKHMDKIGNKVDPFDLSEESETDRKPVRKPREPREFREPRAPREGGREPRPERSGGFGRSDKADRPQRPGSFKPREGRSSAFKPRDDRGESYAPRMERGDKPDRFVRPDYKAKSDRFARPGYPARAERSDRPDRPERPGRAPRPEAPKRKTIVVRSKKKDSGELKS